MEQLIPSDLEKTMKKSKGVPKEKCPIADGITVRLKLSPGGAMLTEDKGVELSVQMGLLATKLKCKMHGEEGGAEDPTPSKRGGHQGGDDGRMSACSERCVSIR